MESALLHNNQENISLNGILPTVRQLRSADKLKLIRILAEELEGEENIFPLEKGKTYHLQTPYNTFGAGEILMNALDASRKEK